MRSTASQRPTWPNSFNMFRAVSAVCPRRVNQAEYPSTYGPNGPGLRRVPPISAASVWGTLPRDRRSTGLQLCRHQRPRPDRNPGAVPA